MSTKEREHYTMQGEGEVELRGRTIGESSIMGYITALTALWSEQASYGINPHPNPRADPAVKALVQSVPRRENERRYEEYHDRGWSRSSACSLNRRDRPGIPGTRICGPPQEKAGRSPRVPRQPLDLPEISPTEDLGTRIELLSYCQRDMYNREV
jgi:hypothetical protein